MYILIKDIIVIVIIIVNTGETIKKTIILLLIDWGKDSELNLKILTVSPI